MSNLSFQQPKFLPRWVIRGILLQIGFKSKGLIWVYVVNRVSGCLPIKISVAEDITEFQNLPIGRPSNWTGYYGRFAPVLSLFGDRQASKISEC